MHPGRDASLQDRIGCHVMDCVRERYMVAYAILGISGNREYLTHRW